MIGRPDQIAAMESRTSAAETSPLVRFYLGQGPDTEGRSLRDIRGWSDERLEAVHDYIQWLFPTKQRSRFNPNAPRVEAEDVRAFQQDGRLRAELIASLRQMLGFYGFDYQEEGGHPIIEPGDDWEEKSENWFHGGNHNLLRITRILDCLSTMGLGGHAQSFLEALETICEETPKVVGDRTLDFWRGAVHGG